MVHLSPLRYPGGKSRGAEKIIEYIPHGTKEICSPFFGGGWVELLCAKNGMNVYGYDKFRPLADFWKCLIKRPKELAIMVAGWWSTGTNGLSKDLEQSIGKLQKELLSPNINQLERATLFYVINRISFSGSTLSGGATPGNPRFTASSVDRILDFKTINKTKNISIDCLDFRESIKKNMMMTMYLDPPYWLKSKLYGKKGDLNFQEKDHLELFEILSGCKKWILSYNDAKEIRKLYHDYQIIELDWAYGMKHVGSKSSEVLILSDETWMNNPIWNKLE